LFIVIIDYGVGNFSSIKNAFKKLGYDAIVSNNAIKIKQADLIVLPGVGSFDFAVKNIELFKLRKLIVESIKDHSKTILGICLGCQLLAEESEESDKKGLGLVDGTVIKLKKSNILPHIGWNDVTFKDTNLSGKYYFSHSFHIVLNDVDNKFATCFYNEPFNAVYKNKNIFGCQFHPEKSGQIGLDFMQYILNFCQSNIKRIQD